jgi:GntR family transcriptional regulator, rspAB operon transcriptional repressor
MHIMERLGKETAREYAYRTIKDNIVSVELVPGSLVSENELAAKMGISRTPVREALIELAKLKLVEIYPQKGSYISLIDSELVEEARFLRYILENTMVEIACDYATEEDLMKLEENVRMQEFYITHLDKDKELQADNAFHELIFEISNKKFTYYLLGGIMTHFDRVRSLRLSTINDDKIISDHQVLVKAIREHNKQLAKEIISQHLSRYIVDAKDLKKQYPTYFK